MGTVFLGLPAIVIAIAENQIKISEDCASIGCIDYIGRSNNVSSELIKNVL